MIDYENVGSNGFDGCEKLNKTDHIHLFYTENAKKIDLDILDKHGDAELVIHKVPAGKQSADMHLGSFLGYLIGSNESRDCSYVVISKDTDFDKVIRFWKTEQKIKVSRVQKIKVLTSTTIVKPPIPIKTSTAKVSSAEKTKLNQEVQQALSKAGYDNKVINDVAQLVIGQYGKEPFMNNVHNELRRKYSNYLDVYEVIKPVIAGYPIQAAASGGSTGQEKAILNREIQQILSKAGMEKEVINGVASIVVKNIDVKNRKQQIYRTIISKYGQQKGLNIYNQIRKHI